GTVVLHEREHDGPPAEKLAEQNAAAVFVGERRIERDRLIEVLIEPDLAQRLRDGRCGDAGVAPVRCRRRAGHLRAGWPRGDDQRRRANQNTGHGIWSPRPSCPPWWRVSIHFLSSFARAGSLRCTVSFIASPIGI